MEGRFFVEEERRMNRMGGRQQISSNCCSSSSLPKEEETNCSHKAVEFACSACLFCVSCPLCIAWCCIKLPCKIGWKAAKNARNWKCCGSQKKVYASYSSFSDIEFDNLTSKVGASSSSSSSSSCRRIHNSQVEGICKHKF